MRVLGIDPGYDRLGIAIVEGETLIHSECLETNRDAAFSERLQAVGERVAAVIKEFEPDTLAVEKTFFNTNQKTAMAVSEARGIVLYEASKAGLALAEYTPGQIKIAVTGYGKSTKKQVEAMVPKLIKIEKDIQHDDEYDAIAAALTHVASAR